ncbi:MAG: sirohydrochlorin chelatase [Pseudonocardiaceae bacterium]|nr:sirohydrochlorin chelatase [Pseudonocardiaceae bacterium]
MTPTLVAVAHGSRDPRSPAAVSALIDVVRKRHPGLDVRVAFLDLSAPRLDAVLADVESAVVVPLLLGRAFHATVDVPGVVAEAVAARPQLDVTVTDVLGPDERLERAALHRLAAAGVDTDEPEVGVVLGAAGSAQAPANAAVADVAARWAPRYRWAGVEPAFACAASPTVPEAVARLRAAGARRIAVASWFLAPGMLPDKVIRQARESGAAALADPLGPDEGVADLIADRYGAALPTRFASPA